MISFNVHNSGQLKIIDLRSELFLKKNNYKIHTRKDTILTKINLYY